MLCIFLQSTRGRDLGKQITHENGQSPHLKSHPQLKKMLKVGRVSYGRLPGKAQQTRVIDCDANLSPACSIDKSF